MAAYHTKQETPTASSSVDILATQFLNKVFSRKEESRRRKRSKLPWESWQLDEEFFRALTQWTSTHPETTLDRVLKSVSDGLENHRDLLDLVPDSPFPARGLITALGHLFKLGVAISRAQREVQDFANDVVRWVGAVQSAFESQGEGQFTRLAWRDLKHMRDLIAEACTWAVERLDDGRWSRIGNGLRIQDEIEEFKKRMNEARALFMDLGAINLAKGLDAILAHLRKLLQRQRIIVYEIKKIRKVQDQQFADIMNELKMQKLAAEREQFLAEALAGHVVADPTYDKQGKRPCDPDTRVEVLAEIDKWINDVSPESRNFLWLTGDPGCGKSAVTASVSKECKKQNVLWAQFFINRNNAETTDPNSYFPSIARQLAHRSTAVAVALQNALQTDRSLTDGISADQAGKLFIDSVRCASQLDPKKPVMVVIDGLDETDRTRLKDTAKIFATVFTTLAAYNNVKVFISSRTENDISSAFILPSHDKYVKRIHLNTAHPSSVRDVSYYIKQNLLALVREHDLNWVVWPGDRRTQVLGERASGLFIWGVTAIKFIQEQLEFDGTECLDDVLDMLTADVLHDVNALYTLILKLAYRARSTDWDLEKFRRIVGAIVFLQEPLCIDDLATLLDLRQTLSSNPVDVIQFVRRLRTILVTGTDVIDGSTVPRIHKSVFEYITSDGVDARFRVDPDHAHLELGMQCLAQLGLAHVSVTKDTLPMPFRYASRFWSSHLAQTNDMGTRTTYVDYRQSPSPPLHSLHPDRILSTDPPITMRFSLADSHILTIQDGCTTPWDAPSGVNLSHHTGEITCLTFSPDGKQLISGSKDKTIRAWDSTNGHWIRTLVKYTTPIHTIAFSPDAKSIVSGSEDGVLCLWDPLTGAPIGKSLSGHKKAVRCVAFSPDGEKITSGSDDTTCILWNVRKCWQVGEPWTGHGQWVRSVAFSASGQRVCSADNDGYCFIWDVSSGRKVKTWRCTVRWSYAISFSPRDDDTIAIGGWEGIKVRSNDQEWTITDSKSTECMSFSSDGKQVNFASYDTVFVAEIGRGKQTVHVQRKGKYRGGVGKILLSPDLRYLASMDKAATSVYAIHQNETSLNIVPVTQSLPVSETNGGNDVVKGILSGLQGVQRNNNAMANNHRLKSIKWYESEAKIHVGDARATPKLLMVTDDAILATYEGGLASVWNRRNSEVDRRLRFLSDRAL